VAKDEGYPISDAVLGQARGYLRSQLITPGPTRARYILDRQVFILYVLARSGFGDVGRTTNIYEYRENLSLYAKAFLAQTLQLLNPEDTERLNTLLDDIMSNAVISATGVRWEESLKRYNWSTNLRTTAIIVDTLIKLRPESDLIPGAIRYLIVQRKADAWETTQETAWTVMALTDWMVESGELKPEYGYVVTLNGEELASGNALPDTVRDVDVLTIDVLDLLADEANQLMFQRTEGQGALYYTAHLNAYVPVPGIEPLNKGIIVERRYLREGRDEPVTSAVVGEVLEVRLTIIAPSSLQYVTIEDPLPAGAEAINPNLQTSQQQDTQPEVQRTSSRSYGWGWWYFRNIDFHDEKVTLNSTYLPAGTYEFVYKMRVGIEGEYNVIPPTAQEFYFPEVYGRGAGMLFTVTAE
jgi:alpha-2-macroglobulin